MEGAAAGNVASAFADAHREDPRIDATGKVAKLLSDQYKGYRNNDAPPKQQKALPAIVLRQLDKNKNTVEDIVACQLAIGAFFFAMRSTEYLKTATPAAKKRTKLLCLKNIRFFYRGAQIKERDLKVMSRADTVSITFEFQKNNERNETITMHRTGDNLLCPVIAWAKIVARIINYSWSSEETPVNYYEGPDDDKIYQFTASRMQKKLRKACDSLGEERLGFNSSDIGTHSIRSGAAMALYLGKVPTFSIMMIGRWSSDAFLRYIRKQVEQFTFNASKSMLECEDFFTTPDYRPSISELDTRQSNDPRNFATGYNSGSAVQSRRITFALMN